MMTRSVLRLFTLIGLPLAALAQTTPDVTKILARLDKLEQQNHQLLEEIQALRQELASTHAPSGSAASGGQEPEGSAPLAERTEVVERRVEELAQTKVESSERMPLAITGMLLFNAFQNSGLAEGQFPLTANTSRTQVSSGASLQQTVLGLRFNGPDLPGGGKASGNLFMDFFGSYPAGGGQRLRIRTGTLDLTWKNTTISVGKDKPIFAPREPESLAQVAISPLTAAGNLWDWQPQVRIEQRIGLGETSGLRAQAGIYQTAEADAYVPDAYANTVSAARPGFEGRLAFWHGSKDRRFEIAPGFHVSQSHVAGASVPSRLISLDGLIRPGAFMEFTGAFFRGENVAGLGSLRQGFTVLGAGQVIPVHATGAWAQATFFPTSRLSLHFYGGQERDRERDLSEDGIKRNFIYAGNIMYRLAPNVVTSFEVSQVRTFYLNTGIRLANHYDLALAYLF